VRKVTLATWPDEAELYERLPKDFRTPDGWVIDETPANLLKLCWPGIEFELPAARPLLPFTQEMVADAMIDVGGYIHADFARHFHVENTITDGHHRAEAAIADYERELRERGER